LKQNISLIVLFFFATAGYSQAPKDLSGNWEGESLCTVPNSPCHNEHVIYHVSQDKGVPGHYTIAADKVVNGEQEWMGDLHCVYEQAKANLRCVKPGVWEFAVNGDVMTGTLKLDDGTLYRKVSVKKK
jgi:hypothetical protein